LPKATGTEGDYILLTRLCYYYINKPDRAYARGHARRGDGGRCDRRLRVVEHAHRVGHDDGRGADACRGHSPQSARFRLINVSTSNTPVGRTVAVWELEIKNLSGGTYDLFPAYQSYVSQIVGGATGVWGASSDAAIAAGLTVTYETVGLAASATQTFTLAAFLPSGSAPDRMYRSSASPPARGRSRRGCDCTTAEIHRYRSRPMTCGWRWAMRKIHRVRARQQKG